MGTPAPEYKDMSLNELIEENNRLWTIRQDAKAEQAKLQPFLDAAWEAKSKADAAKADPSLTQKIG